MAEFLGGRSIYRTIPDGATKYTQKDGLAVAYVVRNYTPNGGILVKAFVGMSGKPNLYFTTKSTKYAEQQMSDLFHNVASHRQNVEQRRAESNRGHRLKVGDIIVNSWSYDQTNVDWYRVVRTTKNFVWLAEIRANVEETGNMSGDSAPAIDTTSDDPAKLGFTDRKDAKVTKHKASGTSLHYAVRLRLPVGWTRDVCELVSLSPPPLWSPPEQERLGWYPVPVRNPAIASFMKTSTHCRHCRSLIASVNGVWVSVAMRQQTPNPRICLLHKAGHEPAKMNASSPAYDLSHIPDNVLFAEVARRRWERNPEAKGGRPAVPRPCPHCGKEFGGRELRAHAPVCMHETVVNPSL
jgi:hypothetical protein